MDCITELACSILYHMQLSHLVLLELDSKSLTRSRQEGSSAVTKTQFPGPLYRPSCLFLFSVRNQRAPSFSCRSIRIRLVGVESGLD